jgi:TPR repeat protein
MKLIYLILLCGIIYSGGLQAQTSQQFSSEIQQQTCPKGYEVVNCTGNGELTFPNGERYVGQLSRGTPEGSGTFTLESGLKFVGVFRRGVGITGSLFAPNGTPTDAEEWPGSMFVRIPKQAISKIGSSTTLAQNNPSASQSIVAPPLANSVPSSVISDRAGKVKKIQETLQARDFLAARELLRPFIDSRDSWGLYILAQMQMRGHGGSKDLAAAFLLAKQLAERAYPPGQAMLSRFYIWGIGVNKDVPEGIRLAKLAAEKNDTSALNLLGILHFEGTGVKQDYSEMRSYWEKAAALRSNVAEANLAYMYLNGLGVAVNNQKALELAQLASDKGSGWASTILGRMYRDGNGIERDRSKAAQYFELSDNRGSVEGIVDLAEFRLRDNPTPESIEGIKRLLDRAADIDDWTLTGQQAKYLAMKLKVEVERLKLPTQVANQQAQIPQQQQAVLRNEKRIALVVGNGNYKIRPLKNSKNDADDVSRSLKATGFEVIDLRDATLPQMRTAVRQFGDRLVNNDVGLVYYSGHGVEVKGRNYFIPVNADIQREDEIADQGLDVSLILEKMSTAGKGVNILIVDACRDDPFGRSFRSSSRGLAQMDAPRGTIIAYATSPGKVASDGDPRERNSPYTKHLVKAMQSPNKPIEQVFKEVRRAVQDETKNQQTPWENTSLSGDFFFRVQR